MNCIIKNPQKLSWSSNVVFQASSLRCRRRRCRHFAPVVPDFALLLLLLEVY